MVEQQFKYPGLHQYYVNNQEKLKAYAKDYYRKNKGKYPCEACKKGYSTKGSLNAHFKSAKHARNVKNAID